LCNNRNPIIMTNNQTPKNCKLNHYNCSLVDETIQQGGELLMRTKNKMDSDAESKEWWEVVEEYFTKELEKNLALHKVDEIFLRYKSEASQKNFPNFICGNPTNTKVSSQDEETETKPSGTTQEEEVQTEESQDLKVEQLKRRSYNQRYHMTLEEGVMKKKNKRKFRN